MPVRTEVPWGATVPEILGTAPAPGPDGWIGRIIDDRYRIVELLGEGGMGAVFVAEHLKLRKQVALKTIRAEFASNAQAEARFAREALATAQIDHPHVVSAIDFGHLPEGGAYLVIQLVRGVSLAAHLDTHGKLGWGTAADLGAQIADALAAAHAAGIVHRDLKPDNILIEARDDGRLLAKVVDFGIAHLTEETHPAGHTGLPLTRMGSILGTPGYMAPEQAVGDNVDHRGDLYSLGVILWECCVGRRLWQGDSVTELVAQQLGGPAPTLQQELGPMVPEPLSEIVAGLLSAAPGKRPDAAGAVRDALRRLALTHTTPSDATGSTALGSAFSAAMLPASSLPSGVRPTSSPLRVQALHLWHELRARPYALPALAGALALVLVCGLWTGGDDDPPAPAASVAAPAPEPTPEPQPIAAAKPTPEPTKPTQAPEPVAEPVAAPPVAVDEPPLPPAIEPLLATLLTGDDKRARKRAAEQVLAHKPKAEVPLHVLNLAWLEKAASCASKRGVIEKMEAAGDPRVLPALRRLSGTPRRGCGFFSSKDCMACLREPLARAIGRLDAKP